MELAPQNQDLLYQTEHEALIVKDSHMALVGPNLGDSIGTPSKEDGGHPLVVRRRQHRPVMKQPKSVVTHTLNKGKAAACTHTHTPAAP